LIWEARETDVYVNVFSLSFADVPDIESPSRCSPTAIRSFAAISPATLRRCLRARSAADFDEDPFHQGRRCAGESA